tara:strand:- start:705 stop:1328 length:624 start_codon:yes stop_codon:yes gene_type:complete
LILKWKFFNMKTLIAYECSFCNLLSKDKKEVESHETGCMLNSLFLENKLKEQKAARQYLDTFRHKVSTLTQLFDMVLEEQEQVIEAIKVIKFYREDIDIKRISNITYCNHGFTTPNKPEPQPMSHSSPVGKKRTSMYPKPENEEKPLAFDLEVFYDVEKTSKNGQYHECILDFIGGINTGGGGSYGQGCHYYCTFWVEDFPLGLKDF